MKKLNKNMTTKTGASTQAKAPAKILSIPKQAGKLIADRYEILTIKGDEVVKDYQTGLMWQRDNGKDMNWEEAKSYAKNLRNGGFSDWRLPTIYELKTLITGVPDGNTFGEEKKGHGENGFYWQKGVWKYDGDEWGVFWSSSELADWADFSWLVEFKYGSVYNGAKFCERNFRCVR